MTQKSFVKFVKSVKKKDKQAVIGGRNYWYMDMMNW